MFLGLFTANIRNAKKNVFWPQNHGFNLFLANIRNANIILLQNRTIFDICREKAKKHDFEAKKFFFRHFQ